MNILFDVVLPVYQLSYLHGLKKNALETVARMLLSPLFSCGSLGLAYCLLVLFQLSKITLDLL